MPSPDFRDRALTAILAGGQAQLPWNKVLTNTLAGSVSCLFQASGAPGAGTYQGSVKNVYPVTPGAYESLLSDTAQGTPSSMRNLLIKLEALSTVANQQGLLLVGDLLATYRGLPADSGVAQDLSLVGSAAGASVLPRYSEGRGVRIFGDVTTAFGATPVTLTVSYTNELGTSGRTSTSTTVASVPAGRSLAINKREPFSLDLQSGDKGVRSLQTATLSGTTGAAGVYTLFLYRPLFLLNLAQAPTGNQHNVGIMNGPSETLAPELLPGCVPIFFWLPTTAVNDIICGIMTTLQVNKGR